MHHSFKRSVCGSRDALKRKKIYRWSRYFEWMTVYNIEVVHLCTSTVVAWLRVHVWTKVIDGWLMWQAVTCGVPTKNWASCENGMSCSAPSTHLLCRRAAALYNQLKSIYEDCRLHYAAPLNASRPWTLSLYGEGYRQWWIQGVHHHHHHHHHLI